MSRSALPIMLVAVAIQVTGAVLMKLLADSVSALHGVLLTAGIGGVLILNVARLWIWGYAHRHFPLSNTFPLSALFFPLMLVVALAFGEGVHLRQILGASFITAGSVWINAKSRRD